jgi:hypothetical protein
MIKINPKITPKILKKYENGFNLKLREEFCKVGGIRANRKSMCNKSINDNIELESFNLTKNSSPV